MDNGILVFDMTGSTYKNQMNFPEFSGLVTNEQLSLCRTPSEQRYALHGLQFIQHFYISHSPFSVLVVDRNLRFQKGFGTNLQIRTGLDEGAEKIFCPARSNYHRCATRNERGGVLREK